ncbi:MAG: ABC transporter permease [Gallionella sp.]
MLTYLIRRILYAIPILIGVNLLTFALFFVVNTPDDMARMQLGVKRVTPDAIEKWKQQRGYDQPMMFNAPLSGADKITHTIFWQKSASMFVLDFGYADDGRSISGEILQRMTPSLAIALPTFVIGLFFYVSCALLMTLFRGSVVDMAGVALCVFLMSVSGLFYIIGGQFLVSKVWHLVPISGYANGVESFKFIVLPIVIGVVSGIGSSSRWYRTIFLEEISKDYVRTARAKGLSELRVLFTGSLLTESFFGIPGLGSYTIDAINAQDFSVVRAMVFLGSLLYIVGLILTDISYTLVDPRVRLQ